MTSGFAQFGQGLILPVVALALLGWFVPRLLARLLPEGIGPLVIIGVLAALIMTHLAGLIFVALYWWQGAPMPILWDAGHLAVLAYFGRIAISSAIIWAPFVILSVASLPKQWVKETW